MGCWAWVCVSIVAGVIIGVGSVIAGLEKIAKIVAWGKCILQWIIGRRHMFRYWWYWKTHSPKCTAGEFSSIKISRSDFSAEMELTINWQSREDIGETEIDGDVTARIGKRMPRLSANPRPIMWQLVPNTNPDITYRLTAGLNKYNSRQLGSTARCKVTLDGILLCDPPVRGSINLGSFEIQVEWVD